MSKEIDVWLRLCNAQEKAVAKALKEIKEELREQVEESSNFTRLITEAFIQEIGGGPKKVAAILVEALWYGEYEYSHIKAIAEEMLLIAKEKEGKDGL